MKWIFILTILFTGMIAEAQLNASPGFVDFGDVAINRGWRQTTVWVRNYSNRPTSVHVNSSCFGNFYSTNNCFNLPANGSCTVQVEFRPRRAGYDSCNINISGNPGGYTSVSVRGRGVESLHFEVNEPFAE